MRPRQGYTTTKGGWSVWAAMLTFAGRPPAATQNLSERSNWFGLKLSADKGAETFSRGILDEVQRHQRERDENQVADPWIVGGEAQLVEDVRIVEHVPEIEVEQIEAIAAFANEDQHLVAYDPGKKVLAGEAEDDATE